MANPTAAMLVIGDEILSGRTRDANMHFLAQELTKHGIDLKEVRIVSDDAPAIEAAVKALSDAYDNVFTSGGIGPTHDDITADCIARAFDTPIDVRDDARALLQAHYDKSGLELNAARLRMARIPDGATLIENPVSTAPGFTLANVHVMAGVPSVFQAMVASVLPTLTGGRPCCRKLCVWTAEKVISPQTWRPWPKISATCPSGAIRFRSTVPSGPMWLCAAPTEAGSTRPPLAWRKSLSFEQ